MPTECVVSGVLYDAQGVILTATDLTFVPAFALQGIDGVKAVMPVFGTGLSASTTITTDGTDASFSITLAVGQWRVFYQGGSGAASIAMTVPAAATANFEDIIGQATTIDSTLLQQVLAAASATAADRVQTGLDATATAADRVQTGLDATATAADRVQTGLDATATAADRVQTGLDAAATAADAAGMKHSVVVLTQTNSDGRLIEASVAESRPYPATGYNTIFAMQVAGDKTAGAAQVNLSGFATLALNDKDGASISAADVWLDGDWLFFVRDQTTFQFHLISVNRIAAGDLPYASDAEALAGAVEKPVKPANLLPLRRNRFAVAQALQPPTPALPVRVTMPEADRMIWTIRLRDSDYRDGYVRCFDDALHVELRDAKSHFSAHNASNEAVWAINAMWATLGGQDCYFANHIWDTLQASGSTETGGSPSTFEWMESIGLNATAEATINAAGGTGIYHGKIDVTNALLLPTGGILNGAPVTDGADLSATLKPGDVLYCSQFDLQTTVTMFADDASTTVATCTNLLRAGGGDQLLWLPSIAHAGNAKVTFGYLAMLPFNGVNRLQGNGSGLTAVQTVAASGSFDFGAATQVVGWNTNQPGRALEFAINGGYAPLRIDGVQQAWSADHALFVLYTAATAKLYLSNYQNSTTGTDVSGETHSTYVNYRAVRADGIT